METILLTGGISDIAALAPEWNALCDEGPTSDPFLRPEWFESLARNFDYSVELVTVRRDGKLRAVLPLTTKKRRIHGLPVSKLQALYNLNTPRFGLIHGADLTEKNDILRSIWNVIKTRPNWTVFETRLVRKDSWLAGLIEIARQDSCRVGEWEMDPAPFIELPRDRPKGLEINDFLKCSRRQLRQQLDRRWRRLNEAGKLEFEIIEVYSPELLDRYFELEARGWKGRNGTAVSEDERVVRLHHEIARSASERNELFAYQLSLDGRAIAMIISIQNDRTMYYWKTAYDEAFSKYSPGNVLFKMFVADCLKREVDEIDLLSPSTVNKRHWASDERPHVAYYVFDRGLLGSFFWFWKFCLASRLRKLRSLSAQNLVPVPMSK